MSDAKQFYIELPSNLTKDEIASLIGKLTEQIKTAPVENKEFYVWAIIDRSGSMSIVADDSIGGFNTFLKEQAEDTNGKTYISTLLFDHEFIEIESMKLASEVKSLTKETHVPRGNTALYDAIGRTLAKAKALNKKNNIFVILTDGYENASTEYDLDKIKELTTEAESKGWRFVYLAANQDAFAMSRALGMNFAAAIYTSNSEGTRSAYHIASNYTKSFKTL